MIQYDHWFRVCGRLAVDDDGLVVRITPCEDEDDDEVLERLGWIDHGTVDTLTRAEDDALDWLRREWDDRGSWRDLRAERWREYHGSRGV